MTTYEDIEKAQKEAERETERFMKQDTGVEDPMEYLRYRDLLLEEIRKKNEWLRAIPDRKSAYVYLGRLSGQIKIPVKYRERAINLALNDMYSYGALQEAIDSMYASDIQVYGGQVTFVTEKGVRRISTEGFMTNDELYSFIVRKLAGTNYRFDLSNPRTDAILPDGYRLHVRGGASGWTVTDEEGRRVTKDSLIATIRKPLFNFTLNQLLETKMFSPEMFSYFEWMQQLGEGFIIGGDVGSGKSTLMAALLGKNPPGTLSCVLEEMPELQPLSEWTGRLYTRPENAEGRGAITMADNLVDTLRMFYDNVYVGEVRTEEISYQFLQNGLVATRQVGTTTHVKTDSKAGIQRICLLAMGEEKRPSWETVGDLFTTSVQHVIISHKRPQGKRITELAEVLPFEAETSRIPYVIISSWDPIEDKFIFHGVTSNMVERARQQGLTMQSLPVQKDPQLHYVRMGSR